MCEFQYKVLSCTKVKDPKFYLYSLNQYNLDDNVSQTGERIYKIHEEVKEKIENLIHEKNIFYPKKIKSALKKLDIIEQTLPTLEQLQNYIKDRDPSGNCEERAIRITCVFL